MAQPSDLQASVSGIQWTNGKGLISGATLLGMFSVILAIFNGLGSWDSSGNFTPNIPSGAITADMLASGAADTNLGASGVAAGSYGAPAQSLSATVLADGRLAALASQPIVVPVGQVTGALPIVATTTVAALPACASATKDQFAIVTDAASPTYRGAPAGGGTVRTLVECDGTAWATH